MHDLSPDLLLDRVLAESALGTTYAGRTAAGAQAVAMVLREDVAAAVTDVAAFSNALDEAGRVAHPALARPLGGGRTAAGLVWAAWEDSAGAGLDERLAREGPLPATAVSLLGARAADALASAHAAGLVHGALSPPLIRGVDAPEGARLAGLGLDGALRAGGAAPERLSRILADERYTAPECMGGARADARGDVYALGTALYEGLTGRPPFGGRTTATLMASVLADEVTGTDRRGARQTPGHVTDAVLRAVEAAPADRWASAADFARALRGGATHAPATPTAAGSGCLGAIVLAATALGALHLLR